MKAVAVLQNEFENSKEFIKYFWSNEEEIVQAEAMAHHRVEVVAVLKELAEKFEATTTCQMCDHGGTGMRWRLCKLLRKIKK